SGRSARAASTSRAPSATVPTRSNSSRSRLTSPSATIAWSSASSTFTRCMVWLSQRDPDAQLGPALRTGVDPHVPPDEPHPLVQTDQPQPPGATCLRQVEPAAVVADTQLQAVG